MFVEPRQI